MASAASKWPNTARGSRNHREHGALLSKSAREMLKITEATTTLDGKRKAAKAIPAATAQTFLRSLIEWFDEDRSAAGSGDALQQVLTRLDLIMKAREGPKSHR
jgi:hypothetical protein